MPFIELTQDRKALVDAKDFKRLSIHRWCARHTKGTWYALRNKGGQSIYMHREILGLKQNDGKYVDHCNRNGLDNRRINLRLCTISSNGMNCSSRRNSTSKFKGVSWNQRRSKWQVRICKNGKQYWLGLFISEKEAASAYNRAASKYHGKFAYLNTFRT